MSGYVLLWSGGKDSALALHRALEAGIDVTRLWTFGDRATERIRFHATSGTMLRRQLSQTVVPVATSEWTEWDRMPLHMEDGLRRFADDGYRGVVVGDIHLADVRAWYEERVVAAGLEHVEPLWGEAPIALLEEFVASGGRAVVTCVDTEKLDDSWLGRVIDEAFVDDIAALDVDACGENGEYHSFAFAGPAFTRPVQWQPGERRFDGRFAQLDLLPG